MTTVDEQLDALYAELPAINCQGYCSDSCGPIEMSRAERERITRDKGLTIDARSFFADGPSRCVALNQWGRCSVYPIRPLICRLWGLTRRMPCTYGCRPARWLTDAEAYEFLARAHDISLDHTLADNARQAAAPGNQARLTLANDLLDLEVDRILRDRP